MAMEVFSGQYIGGFSDEYIKVKFPTYHFILTFLYYELITQNIT